MDEEGTRTRNDGGGRSFDYGDDDYDDRGHHPASRLELGGMLGGMHQRQWEGVKKADGRTMRSCWCRVSAMCNKTKLKKKPKAGL